MLLLQSLILVIRPQRGSLDMCLLLVKYAIKRDSQS
jgi:hypothetical protein